MPTRPLRRRTWTVTIAVAAALAAGACKKDGAGAGESASAASGPFELVWSESYKLDVSGSEAEATFFMTKEPTEPMLKLRASFSDFPAGTKVSIGGEEKVLDDGGFWQTNVDVKAAVLKQSLDDLRDKVDLDVELTLTPPGGPPAKTKLQKQDVKEGLRAALMKARDGGVSFGAGDDGPAKPRGAAVVAGYSDLDFVGAAKTPLELDWVAIGEEQKEPRATKSCEFKEGASTLKMIDTTVTIYDRRTGKKIDEKVLAASDRCPMFAFVDKKDNSTKNTVSSQDVATWVRERLQKGT